MDKRELLHDVKNSLGVISTYSQLLGNKDYHKMLSTEKILDIAHEIQTATHNIIEILERELRD